jgi:PAS domain S-box-containing protein
LRAASAAPRASYVTGAGAGMGGTLSQGADEERPAPADGPAAPHPAAPDGPAGTLSRSGRVPDAITRAGGLLCAAVGLTVIAAWYARAAAILSFGSQNPMSFNTALGFVVTGVALVALARTRPRAALAAGLFDAGLGAVTLAEYALGHGLGIDQLFVKAYLSAPGVVAGRPAINTALCLTLTGAALLVWGPWRPRRRPTVVAAAGSVIGAIAVAATFGYATGNSAAYGWWHVSAMPFLTAVTMLVLALALLSAAWRDSRPGRGGLPGWLPMPAGALALGLGVWVAIAGQAVAVGRISEATFTGAASALGLVMGGMVTLVVWLAQHAEGRRQAAVAEAARRSAAELVAREGEQRLFQFLDAMPIAVFITSQGGQPYYANGEAERILGRGLVPGIGAEELAETYRVFQAGTSQLYPTESLSIVQAALGQSSHCDDMEIHKPDGAVIPLEIWGRPVYGAGGKIDYAIAAFVDMTERHARETIIAGQAALLELAHDAIFVRDLDGRITYWSAGAEQTYGFTSAEALGQMTHDMLRTLYPEPLASIEAATTRYGRWDGELTHRRADGQTIIVESRWAAQRGPGGSLLGFMEINRDMTERHARETIIAGQAALLELAYDAIFVRDPDGHITYWNAGAEHTYGFTRAQALGQIARDMLSTQYPEPLADIEAAATRYGRWDGELTHRRADGQTIIVESRWAAQRGSGGALLGFMEINRDVTFRKDAEREMLQRAGEIQALNATLEQRVQQRTVHLERASKNLAAFTYTAAHDLRTPLRALSGFSEALVEEYGGRLDETGRGYAGRIQAASGHMATVLDDLLDLSRLSTAEMNLQDVDLSAEVTAICGRLRARDPGRRVMVTVQDGVRAIADRPLIRTVLENLLDNAWKFTAGREHATIEFAATPAEDAPLCCYVRDNGAGFDPAYADKLFQPFQRLHAASEYPGTGTDIGTGTGLASVQRIIDRHGGRTWAEGAVDGGATFYFTLNAKDTP